MESIMTSSSKPFFAARAALVALATSLLLTACQEAESQAPTAPPPRPVAVEAIVVAPQPVQLDLELPGRTAAYRVAEVRPQVSGIVQKRVFDEGSEVQAGQLLYQIDPATYQATLASAEAALAKSEAMEYSARLRADRYQNLAKTRAVSDQEQIDIEAQWKQSLAEVAISRAALQHARINLDYTRVTAPISGRIGKTQVSEGALVTAQQATALATIQQLDPLYVDVSQSANELLQLKRQLAVGAAAGGSDSRQLQTEVRLLLDDNSLYSETGLLEFSEATVDQSTGTVTIRAVIANPRLELLPGMFVRARLLSSREQEAILVPQASILRNNRGQAMVMLVGPESKVEARVVETGRNIGDKVVVQEGLVAGEQLIVAGLQKIRPGAVVEVSGGGKPPAAAGPPTAGPPAAAAGSPAAADQKTAPTSKKVE